MTSAPANAPGPGSPPDAAAVGLLAQALSDGSGAVPDAVVVEALKAAAALAMGRSPSSAGTGDLMAAAAGMTLRAVPGLPGAVEVVPAPAAPTGAFTEIDFDQAGQAIARLLAPAPPQPGNPAAGLTPPAEGPTAPPGTGAASQYGELSLDQLAQVTRMLAAPLAAPVTLPGVAVGQSAPVPGPAGPPAGGPSTTPSADAEPPPGAPRAPSASGDPMATGSHGAPSLERFGEIAASLQASPLTPPGLPGSDTWLSAPGPGAGGPALAPPPAALGAPDPTRAASQGGPGDAGRSPLGPLGPVMAGAPAASGNQGATAPWGMLSPGADPQALAALLARNAPFAGPMPASLFEAREPRDDGAHTRPSDPSGGFDVAAVRRDFPILSTRVNGHLLAWLDNAATTQKPRQVIDAVSRYYEEYNSNVHRGAHTLARRATQAFEDGRAAVRRLIKARRLEEIVFVRGATEGINLVAQTHGRENVGEGDEIIVTHLEHHSNIVPWQMLVREKKARLRVVPIDDRGEICLDAYEALFGPRTRLVAMSHASNALGTVTPVAAMTAIAHRFGVPVLVDGAQSIPHLPVDVQSIDCDFFVFSGHKLFGPTGIGVVYGRHELLSAMPPWQGGGNMIADVTFEETKYNQAPEKFEAGTPSVAEVVGLRAAVEYVEQIGLERAAHYEQGLLDRLLRGLCAIPGVRLIGTARERIGVVSFVLEGVKNETIGQAADREGIAVRVGHHCAQPAVRRFGVEATVRPSLAFYNTEEEVERFLAVIRRLSQERR